MLSALSHSHRVSFINVSYCSLKRWWRKYTFVLSTLLLAFISSVLILSLDILSSAAIASSLSR